MPGDTSRKLVADYAAAGAERSGLWRVVIGLLLIATSTMLVATLILLGISVGHGLLSGSGDPTLVANAIIHGSGPMTTAFHLGVIALLWPATWVALRLLHKQPFLTVFSPERRIRWREFWTGAAMMLSAFAIAAVVGGGTAPLPERSDLELSRWAIMVLPFAALVFFQATAEEIVLRGYLLQQLALRSLNPLIWAALPSLLFGFLHWDPRLPGDQAVLYVVATFFYGLLAAATVAKTGSLATAMGMHVATNVLAITIIAAEGPLSSAALFVQASADGGPDFVGSIAISLVLLALVLSPYSPVRPRL